MPLSLAPRNSHTSSARRELERESRTGALASTRPTSVPPISRTRPRAMNRPRPVPGPARRPCRTWRRSGRARRRDADSLVGDGDLDGVGAALRRHGHGPAARRVLDGVREELVEHLPQLVGIRLRPADAAVDLGDEPVAVRVSPAPTTTTSATTSTTSVGARVTVRSPLSSRATLSSASTIVVSRSDSRAMKLEERAPLLVREADVLAQQRLREAVDRRERRAQLDRHRRDEVGLHLLELVLGRDVAEREDAARDRSGRVAHHRLRERQPHVVARRA